MAQIFAPLKQWTYYHLQTLCTYDKFYYWILHTHVNENTVRAHESLVENCDSTHNCIKIQWFMIPTTSNLSSLRLRWAEFPDAWTSKCLSTIMTWKYPSSLTLFVQVWKRRTMKFGHSWKQTRELKILESMLNKEGRSLSFLLRHSRILAAIAMSLILK